jgi:hypothetical protein
MFNDVMFELSDELKVKNHSKQAISRPAGQMI